jgi:invasion protein IalB
MAPAALYLPLHKSAGSSHNGRRSNQGTRVNHMKIMDKNVLCCAAGALLISFFGSASAQQPPRPPAPRAPAPPAQHTVQDPQAGQPDVPQRTTATYEDWIVQCETQNGPPAQKQCDMSQITQVQVQGKSQPFSRVAIPHPAKGQPVKLIVQLPVNASFAANVKIQTSDSDPGLAAPFARCVPNGCFADFEIKDDAMKKFRAATGSGKLSFADSGARDVTIPISFKGFSQAYEALLKE